MEDLTGHVAVTGQWNTSTFPTRKIGDRCIVPRIKNALHPGAGIGILRPFKAGSKNGCRLQFKLTHPNI